MKQTLTKKTLGIFYSALLLSGAASAQYSPTPKFEGKIGKTLQETKEVTPKVYVNASAGAPNIVWIQIDDIGYGAISSFGGLIETPNIDRLAKQGLRFTNYHTTAFCAPTRAALLTGRNQHSVHFGFFANTSLNTPGYDGYLPFEKATAAEILRENGYNTFAIGKYHLTHPSDATQAGPFNRWPTGRGFDHYFGFSPEVAATDQWHPILYRDTQREPEDAQGRHVTELLSNEAIKFISGQKSAAPDKPFFLYYAPGAVHAPLQVSKEWIDKYKGKFSGGWDKYKETVLRNQKALGVIPADTKLPPKNPGVKDWNALSANEKILFERYIELYAGFVSQTDHEIGRIINHIEQLGQLDNTIIAVMVGDNGAEGAGREVGRALAVVPNETHEQTVARYVKNLDKLGTENSSVLYADGWAAATNTPFRFYKSYGNFEGGTHDPLILFYPKKIKDKGGIRNQYTHVNDILPTTLELAGAKVPSVINGYTQEPIEGSSLAYTVDAKDKNAAERHTVQYHEMTGSYAIYKDGWKASFPRDRSGRIPKADERLYLYNVKQDFNELNNLADKYPDKVKELAEVFDKEAWKYNVYPLKDQWETLNQSTFDGKTKVTLYPQSHYTSSSVFRFSNASYAITAHANIPSRGAEGVLLSYGNVLSGISLYIKNNKLVFAYNAEDRLQELSSEKVIPTGNVTLRAQVVYSNEKKDKEVTIFINNEKVGSLNLGTITTAGSGYDGFEVGRDLGTTVSSAYQAPFNFTGVLRDVVIEKI
jgi:arylsulfatase